MWIDPDPKDNLNEARLSHQDNAKVIILESHPQILLD